MPTPTPSRPVDDVTADDPPAGGAVPRDDDSRSGDDPVSGAGPARAAGHGSAAEADSPATDHDRDADRPAGPVDPADRVWFDGVVRAHATAVHRFVVRRVGRQDAEDLTADVLTVAWRRRADVPRGAELPWLYRTAGFVLANHVRKARPVPVQDVPDTLDLTDPAVVAVRDEQVRTVLSALAPRDRQILLLNAWEGLAGQALADVLGISRGGADAALSRARARLREAWDALDAADA
ncbi:sigma-70 family RNA polymerase sigma factor [Cellulomonas fimi]|uniref:RNA polymerase sigma factor n=1 Tax=Cellulomonas fimi TaxID=1708 RepID=UPI00234CFBBA|nr:sigma-70 family RNA polymerase sigma factor [Cellulomonas fimi]MDC7120317.1 sigma-70 family RNA polymerase sigma factor [Cellulomonas fimi]